MTLFYDVESIYDIFKHTEKKLYFLDETWVNVEHFITKVWKDETVSTDTFLKRTDNRRK